MIRVTLPNSARDSTVYILDPNLLSVRDCFSIFMTWEACHLKPDAKAWMAIIDAFIAPTRAFQAIKQKAPVFPPYVISSLLLSLSVAVSLPLTLKAMEAELSTDPAMQGFLFSFDTYRLWFLAGGTVSAVIGPWLMGLIVAAMLVGGCSLKGHTIDFAQIYSMVGYARLPLCGDALISALLVTQTQSLAQINRISLSLAVFAPSTAPPIVLGVLTSLNPFRIWYLFLLVVGLAYVSKSSIRGTLWAGLLLFACNLLFSLLGVGLFAQMGE